MTIQDITMKIGATFPTTDGSAYTLTSNGSDLNRHVITDAFNALALQVSMAFSVLRAKPLASAPNGYSQSRRNVFIKMPKLLANGKYTTNTVKIDFSSDIETSDAEHDLMRDLAVQCITGTGLDAFYHELSTQ